MNNGDTFLFILDYTVDGEPIQEDYFDEIEFSIGNKQYLLSKEEIAWDSNISKYTVFIPQADTLNFSMITKYQLRVRKGTEVASSKEMYLLIGNSISKDVI